MIPAVDRQHRAADERRLVSAQKGDPGSFTDTLRPGAGVAWQQLIYFSYVSLTTLGFGDILSASTWARSLVSRDAVTGVLYLAILMARLVGLYGQRWLPVEDSDED